jgi:hypothetical protein
MGGCQTDGLLIPRGWMSDGWAAHPSQPIRPTSTHQRDTHCLSYPLTDGNFLGYQNDLTLPVLRKLKYTIYKWSP